VNKIMESIECDSRSLVMAHVMTPDHANFAGNIHGGYIMELLDQVGYACASRYASSYVVTLSVDAILFKQPVHVGELVSFYARVNYVGRSSMEVGVKVIAENLISGEKRHTNSCYLTFVAVDEQLKSRQIKAFTPEDPCTQRRYQEAILRREMRKQYKVEHEKNKAAILQQQNKKPL
jgi:acyl-CoA hydrolase